MTKTLGITICRRDSQGIPRKAIQLCGGHPLCHWALDVAAELYGKKKVDRYVVVSDDPTVLKIARHKGLPTLVEPRELATETATSDDVIKWALRQLGPIGTYKYIIELMVTNPLYTYLDAFTCIEALRVSNADSVIAVTPLGGYHPARAKRIEGGLIQDWCEHCEEGSTQRQRLSPPAYVRASAIYAFTREALFRVGRFGHERSLAYILPPERGVGIDTMADLMAANWYLRERQKRDEK